MKEMTDYDRFLERQRIADERALKMGYGKAMQDALVGGTGITKNGERIDPASIYAEPVPLTEVLNNPEEHYPGNFDTPERANALLTSLCQDASAEINRLVSFNQQLMDEVARLQKREWVGLTRDEVLDIEETTKHPLAFYRAIEVKLKEKNHA